MNGSYISKSFSRIPLLLVLIAMCMILSGCPSPPSTDYKGMFLNDINIEYRVNFDTVAPPTVNIYYFVNGMNKTAVFQLDGYDAEKNVGYKIVTVEDKNKWEQEYKDGITNTPDINDVALIQEAAANYEFPIFFICIYDYQNDYEFGKIVDNQTRIRNEYENVKKLEGIRQWSEKLLYDGEIIKINLEMYCFNYYSIEYSHVNLPTVEIKYGDNKKAVFQLDGYDKEKLLGYKFVTEIEKLDWGKRRSKGDIEAPDILDYELIKEFALDYNFPVFFIYMPEYWKASAGEVYKQEMSYSLERVLGNYLDYERRMTESSASTS